jgi:hypothetical protein
MPIAFPLGPLFSNGPLATVHSDDGLLCSLLRTRRNWPRHRHTAEQRNELAPFQ